MKDLVKVEFEDLRDTAIALNEFETSLGAMMLSDLLEGLLSGRSKPAEQLTKVLQNDKEALKLLTGNEHKFSGKVEIPWQKARVAKEVSKIGQDKVMSYLNQSAKELGEDRNREALVMAKTAKMIDFKGSTSAFDRTSLAKLFGPIEIDRRTGKKITGKQATEVRAAALAALAKLTPELRAEIRVWSASAPLRKKTRFILSRMWGWRFFTSAVLIPLPITHPNSPTPPPTPAQTTYTELRFNLHRVDCLSDTNGGEMGRDEIELGGTDVTGMENAPADAIVGIFGPVPAGSFNTGESETYPPYVLNNWGLSGLSYPQVFLVNLLMSEKDANDKFADILEDLAAATGPDLSALITAVSAAAGAAAGAAIGGALGTAVTPLIGSIIGLVIGALIGLLGAWISGAVNPEVFENIRSMAIILDNPYEFRDGSTSTPHEIVTYIDHGGHYTVRCNFTLS